MFTFEQTKQIQSAAPISRPRSIGDFYYTSEGELYVVGKIPRLNTFVYRQVCGDQWIFSGVDMMYVPNPIEVLFWLNRQAVGSYNISAYTTGSDVSVTYDSDFEYVGNTAEDAIFSALINRHEVLGTKS